MNDVNLDDWNDDTGFEPVVRRSKTYDTLNVPVKARIITFKPGRSKKSASSISFNICRKLLEDNGFPIGQPTIEVRYNPHTMRLLFVNDPNSKSINTVAFRESRMAKAKDRILVRIPAFNSIINKLDTFIEVEHVIFKLQNKYLTLGLQLPEIWWTEAFPLLPKPVAQIAYEPPPESVSVNANNSISIRGNVKPGPVEEPVVHIPLSGGPTLVADGVPVSIELAIGKKVSMTAKKWKVLIKILKEKRDIDYAELVTEFCKDIRKVLPEDYAAMHDWIKLWNDEAIGIKVKMNANSFAIHGNKMALIKAIQNGLAD